MDEFAGSEVLGDLGGQILDILPGPVFVKDCDLRFVFVNRAFEDMFGVRKDDLIALTDEDVFHGRRVTAARDCDFRILKTGAPDESVETVLAQGLAPREVVTRKSRLTLADGSRFLLGVVHDITEVTLANRLLAENKAKLEGQAAALAQLARTDPLTGCLNRRAITDLAPERFQEHRNRGCLMLLDIDHFKAINDTHGHDAGDAALVHFTKLVLGSIRATDCLARLGGEEFSVIVPGANRHEAEDVAERIRRRVADTPLVFDGKEIFMTVSIGAVQSIDPAAVDLEALLKSADGRLYAAKKAGRNQVVWEI